MNRREWFGTAAACLGAGCQPSGVGSDDRSWDGGWVGDAAAVAHRWRDGALPAAIGPTSRTGVLIVGAGVAGLAAARALRRAGIDDFRLLELHERAGGNSRGHALAGQGCPLGAHYLPVPGPAAWELLEWLHEIGVARQEGGRTRWDERYLCHAPQERLWFEGEWHEGLFPPLEAASAAHAQAGLLATAVRNASRDLGFAMPAGRAPWKAGHAALDALTFANWLDAQGIVAPELRWYLDYCCRDDYGEPASEVSAWAGLHYFASRRGFMAAGESGRDEGAEPVLTWPQGNAWLVERLSEGLGERLLAGRLVHRVTSARDGVEVDAWVEADGRSERWHARQVVLAMPLAWVARVLADPPEILRRVVGRMRLAPWLVANLELSGPVLGRPGVPPAWDNVEFGRPSLGYVDAGHQRLSPQRTGAVVLTAYHAPGRAARASLLGQPWQFWAAQVVDELARVHPDLPRRVRRVDLARHGHAMSIPIPGLRSDADLRTLREGGSLDTRLHLAHSDLAGYSVFEEAFTLGTGAGERVAAAWGAKAAPRRSS